MAHFKKIVEEIGGELGDQNQQNIRQQLQMNLKEFAGKVAAFNKLGETLYNGGKFDKLAEELDEIATHAEAYTLQETNGEWFDQVTVKRNMKELKGYSGDFKKVAGEARALQERMTALYEDCGRVLGRYFEIKEMGQPDGMGDQNDLAVKGENEKIVNARAGVRESHTNCPGCENPMSECTCEGVMNEATKCSVCGKPTKENTYGNPKFCQGHSQSEIQKLEKNVPMKKEGKMSLKKLMEDITDDRPKDDWVKLDVPMLRYDVALKFEKDLKKKGFSIRRHDWKEREGQGQEFSEFWTKLKDFDEANKYAVGAYQNYENNSRMEND